jgi:hypothetical protein
MPQPEADESKHKAAYSGRKSESTRNPHSSKGAAPNKRIRELQCLCYEDRVLEQWRASMGCPVSDEAKVQFQVQALNNAPHALADVRLWLDHHDPKTSRKVKDTGTIYLEFFFDGSKAEYKDDEEAFTRAFETMIERQLQERRLTEFRKKLQTRRRGAAARQADDCGEGGEDAAPQDDKEWKEYLHRPIPATKLTVESIRESGCMLTFLVVQTSLSISAGEVLGQTAFQEHFPIDGQFQDRPKSDKPMPRWAYGLMCCTATMTTVTVFAWWQIVKYAIFPHPESPAIGP